MVVGAVTVTVVTVDVVVEVGVAAAAAGEEFCDELAAAAGQPAAAGLSSLMSKS